MKTKKEIEERLKKLHVLISNGVIYGFAVTQEIEILEWVLSDTKKGKKK